ncbi:class B sortase [Adlercreutzia sp. ZJ154]|uniref:class B sortase n=1 Tax=Adlercreutzia sp. ZJ154 TaxID=2709790 RepID=UPI0013ED0B12|nr:class B sortase [Adlercreutzia sp. ZJ154]
MTYSFGPKLNGQAGTQVSHGSVQPNMYQHGNLQGNRVQMQPPMQPNSQKPSKKQKRKGGAWRVVFILAIVVLACALGGLGWLLFTYWNGQNEYTKLSDENFTINDSSGVTTLGSFDVDWDALRAINPDVVGWVYVPGTNISYPICWRKNDDKYYLKHNFGQNSVGDFGAEYGCIMLAGVNSPDWTDQVNVIYGHHMANGTMFATLGDFAWSDELFNQLRTFYVLTPEGNFRTTSFAVDKVPGSSTDIVIPDFDSMQDFHDYVQKRIDTSTVNPDPPAPPVDDIKQVFAFSTCSYPDVNYRIVTFCSVDEFLPAGSTVSQGNSLVDQGDIESVEGAIAERLL